MNQPMPLISSPEWQEQARQLTASGELVRELNARIERNRRQAIADRLHEMQTAHRSRIARLSPHDD